jgi:dTDP-4-dehydrorhamnose reductase
VEAVRVLPEGVTGPRALLAQAWERYSLPLAVTEVHLGGTREQQLRWLSEVWTAASEARDDGADVRAVTAWAAFGTRDWSSLVTRLNGEYEPGLFDVRGPVPRPTALASMARALAQGKPFDHPTLDSPGWWCCPERIVYPQGRPARARPGAGRREQQLLVTGAAGTLGSALVRLCEQRGLAARGLDRGELDVTSRADVDRMLGETDAWAVVNTAGFVRVDDAEDEAEACRRENVDGATVLASACAARGIPLVTVSSDLVFDGAKRGAYVESDAPVPLGVYGATKALAEARVLECHPCALVVRTAAFFGPWDEANFLTLALRSLAAGVPVVAANDLIVTPTYVPDLAHAALDLLVDGERGIWHLTNGQAMTWADFACAAARVAGLDSSLVMGLPHDTLGFRARRPPNAALGSERGLTLPSLEQALSRYAAERPWMRAVPSEAASSRFAEGVQAR